MQSKLGVGSCFWIDLPKGTLKENAALEDFSTDSLLKQGSEVRTILYIEDNPSNIKLVNQIIMRLNNVRLLAAHTAEIGISIAETRLPELILLDINLPGIDGFKALASLKSIDALKEVPVIAVTANAMPKDIDRGKAAGFDEYLTKPIDIKMFLHTIGRFLNANGKEIK